MKHSAWITDWAFIVDDKDYIVCPINARPDKSLYLGQPTGVLKGWEVARLMKGCYAALICPAFNGAGK